MNQNPNQWQSLAEKGVAALRQNQVQDGLSLLVKAAQQAPREPVLRYWLANAYRMNGDVQRAEQIFREVLTEKPGDFDPSFGLAFLLRDIGKPEAAAEVLTTASEQPGSSLNQLLQITGFMRDSNQFEAAIPVCLKALKLSPRRADLHFKLARLYQATGDFSKALEHLQLTIDLKPSIGPAWTTLAQQRTFDSTDDQEFKRIEAAASQNHGHEANMCIAFAYGKALDDLKRWAKAWKQYERGNELLSLTRLWNQDAWNRVVQRATAGSPVVRQVEGDFGSRAVFIVGMPRSGTSLLERLLAREPNITGRGELNFLDHFVSEQKKFGSLNLSQKQQMGNSFWKQLRLDGSDRSFFVDKNPLNFRYLDTLFDLLPGAKVIHMRRDGRDSCLSCYFQPFEHNDAAFSNNLDHLIRFYAGYNLMMERWAAVYPGRIHIVNYDDLVTDTDRTMAQALDFVGVDSSTSATEVSESDGLVRSASAWQARQPVHQDSVERWRRYYEQAPAFFDRIASIDEAR